MPKVSEFFGIAIYFYFSDHPPPHFHAFYGEYKAILQGTLPKRAYGLVVEWALQHREDLRRAWRQAATPCPVDPIDPLSKASSMHRIVAVKPLPGFRVWLRFTDGSEGEADLSHLAGRGVFAAWNDPAEFAKVSVDPGTKTICWPGGIDLDPDVLYHQVTGKPAEWSDRKAAN